MSPTTVYNKSAADKFVTGKHVDLVVVECTCGLLFAIPDGLYRSAKRWRGPDGWQISCPLGHTWHYRLGQTDEERLEEAQRQLQATRNLLAAEERSHAATRGHLTRQKRRAAAGVCPCCNRTCKQLARHMEGQHPEYVAAVRVSVPAKEETP